MKLSVPKPVTFWVAVVFCGLVVSCSSAAVPPPTPVLRIATQTPWIIYVAVTLTPQPATVTPLPTITNFPKTAARIAPTRTPAKVAATPSKTRAVAVAAALPATPLPTCRANPVTLLFPENGVPRGTRKEGTGGSAFILKWTPFQGGESDPTMGYMVTLSSKRSGYTNGDTAYVSHNQFLGDGQQYIYDQVKVSRLANGEDSTVTWNATVVKTTGGFDGQGGVIGRVVNCSAPSQTFTIQLVISNPG